MMKDLVFRMLNGVVEAYEGSDQFAVVQISQCLSKWLCVRSDAIGRSDASARTKLSTLERKEQGIIQGKAQTIFELHIKTEVKL